MGEENRTTVAKNAPTSVYIHVPFCRAKCAYCDFNSYGGRETLYEDYTTALCAEAERYWRAKNSQIRTVYLGGGTPTVLDPSQMERILVASAPPELRADDVEVTVEANPGTIDIHRLSALPRFGVNRLSFGVQSLDDSMLKLLGRIHTAEEALLGLESARRAGFDNINLDFIYGLPNQSLVDWQRTVEQALRLNPEHLSLYALSVEEGTPLATWVERGQVIVPDQDEVADMYNLVEMLLAEAGYEHYEISNWARPGRASRHNLVYWANEPYLGFGAGAHSYVDGCRRHNVADPADYIAKVTGLKSPIESAESITPEMEMAETMFLGLRRSRGVSLVEFSQRFGRDLSDVYGSAVAELTELGLIDNNGEHISLTSRGRLLGNEVFVRFLPSVQ